MVTTVEISGAIAVTTIMVRQRITDQAITTDVAIETIIITTIIIAIENIMVFTGVSIVTNLVIATDHINTDAMVAGNKKIYFVKN
jgi:hypothetical protein